MLPAVFPPVEVHNNIEHHVVDRRNSSNSSQSPSSCSSWKSTVICQRIFPTNDVVTQKGVLLVLILCWLSMIWRLTECNRRRGDAWSLCSGKFTEVTRNHISISSSCIFNVCWQSSPNKMWLSFSVDYSRSAGNKLYSPTM